ncbi:hypothetical protein [Streptomyces violaceorubidus]|uniref:hypothetical protein n=1 Tax=Streptomyces violaceorubidus TaxID=284042 RepID=UPI0005628418|nr:hypothetical protein [Streptomyces violaceorubidus]
MTDHLTTQQLADIERAVPRLSEYSEQSDDVRTVAEGVPALLAEIRRLQAELTEAAEDVTWLRCLEAAGVDNWEGIETAIEMRGE